MNKKMDIEPPKAAEVVIPVPDSKAVDAKTISYFIYLLYKINLIDRYGIKAALDVIRRDTPDDIIKYLVDETKKV